MLSRDLWKKKPSTWTVIGLAPDRVIVKPVVFPGQLKRNLQQNLQRSHQQFHRILQWNQSDQSMKIHQVQVSE